MGLSASAVELLEAVLLVASQEADELWRALPRLSRSMAVSTVDVPERMVGAVRGPILWTETVAARAATYGDTAVFVCSSTARAYDTAENRVLAHVLSLLARAAALLAQQRTIDPHGELARHAHRVGHGARSQLEAPSLSSVPRTRPTPREVRRARSSRRTSYGPALALLDRAGVPFAVADLEAVVDGAGAAHHALLIEVIRAVEATGRTVPPLRVDDGVLLAGPVSFRHPGLRRAHPAGVVVGDVALMLPDAHPPAAARAGRTFDVEVAAAEAAGCRAVLVQDLTGIHDLVAGLSA